MHIFLETERLILRQFTEDDIDNLVALDGDPEVMRFLTGGKATSRHEIETDYLPAFLRYYERFDCYGFWAAIEKPSGDFLGWFHFRPLPDAPAHEPELGYRLIQSAWGKGYGTEGSRALIDRGFSEFGVHRVTASTMTVNTGSRRVMEKSGLRLIRTFHMDWPEEIAGSEHGDVEYAITREEWEAQRLADHQNNPSLKSITTEGANRMPPPLQFGIIRPFGIPWLEVVQQWRRIEAAGFDSVWGIDHFNRPTDPGASLFESWTALSALAAVTSRIRIGLLVTSNTFRHPALLAKEAVTVDHISHGRLELGIGAGGFEAEHRTFGLPYPPPVERVERLRESIEAIDLLLTQDRTTYHGNYVQFADAPFRPGPIQKPRPPITIAAHGPKMIALAAKHANRWNSYGTVEEMADRIALLNRACAEIGRNPAEITHSLYARSASLGLDPWESPDRFVEIVKNYQRVGVNELILDPPNDDQWPLAERIAAEVIPHLRERV